MIRLQVMIISGAEIKGFLNFDFRFLIEKANRTFV